MSAAHDAKRHAAPAASAAHPQQQRPHPTTQPHLHPSQPHTNQPHTFQPHTNQPHPAQSHPHPANQQQHQPQQQQQQPIDDGTIADTARLTSIEVLRQLCALLEENQTSFEEACLAFDRRSHYFDALGAFDWVNYFYSTFDIKTDYKDLKPAPLPQQQPAAAATGAAAAAPAPTTNNNALVAGTPFYAQKQFEALLDLCLTAPYKGGATAALKQFGQLHKAAYGTAVLLDKLGLVIDSDKVIEDTRILIRVLQVIFSDQIVKHPAAILHNADMLGN